MMNEETLFHLALAQPADQRAAFLRQACGADMALHRRLEALLAAHQSPDDFLAAPAPATVAVDQAPARHHTGETVGSQVGPYKLLQRLGEGGMGSVWVAEQTEPVKRRVALKLIKPGMDSAKVLHRFEAEQQALALMDHTHIARVLDAGTTDAGRPYFVMELVKGIPITKYCDELHLSVTERLALFIPVCQAIQHAHQKGIIHRDIKPSNILVAVQDGKPIPKVIDFGVAKALNQRLTEESVYTELGAFIGTLEYMSPEQAELSALDIDTRADIYALGVLLYELLTGSTPLDRKRLRQAALMDVVRLIKEEEPPRPSTRLTESKEQLGSLAAQRRTDPGRLAKEVRGELDWIVMKCLEKDRTRRYDSASGLARDLERYLQDEPLEASPPSRIYRTRKFLRKHRAGVLTAAAFVSLLLLGLGASIVLAVRAASAEAAAAHERDQAEANASKAQAAARAESKARADAEANQQEAKRAALAEKQARAAAETKEQQAVEAAAAAKAAKDEEARQRQKAETAAAAEKVARIEEAAQRKQADAVAALLESLFNTLDPRSEEKGDLPVTKQLIARLDALAASLDKDFGGSPLVRARLREALGRAQLGLGEAMKAVHLQEQALAERQKVLGDDHAATLRSKFLLGQAYLETGKLQKAVVLMEQVLPKYQMLHGADNADTLVVTLTLAQAYQAAGQIKKALPLFEDAYAGMTAKLGRDDPETLSAMNSLALAYRAAGALHKALPLLEQSLLARKAHYGPDHPATLASMGNLAGAYRAAGQLNKALPLYEQALSKWTAKLGSDHPRTLIAMDNLAVAYLSAHQVAKALPLLEMVLEKMRAKLGPNHIDTLTVMNNLAYAYQDNGQLDKALALQEQVVEGLTVTFGADDPRTLVALDNLAQIHLAQGHPDRAVPLLELALAGSTKRQGPDHSQTLITQCNLGTAYLRAGQADKGMAILEDVVKRMKSRPAAEQSHLPGVMANLSQAYHAAAKFEDEEALLRECLSARVKLQPDNWETYNTKALLGGALLAQKKYEAAEPLLLEGYKGMKQRVGQMPASIRPQLSAALDRLVQLYDAMGQKEKAAEWRKVKAAEK